MTTYKPHKYKTHRKNSAWRGGRNKPEGFSCEEAAFYRSSIPPNADETCHSSKSPVSIPNYCQFWFTIALFWPLQVYQKMRKFATIYPKLAKMDQQKPTFCVLLEKIVVIIIFQIHMRRNPYGTSIKQQNGERWPMAFVLGHTQNVKPIKKLKWA